MRVVDGENGNSNDDSNGMISQQIPNTLNRRAVGRKALSIHTASGVNPSSPITQQPIRRRRRKVVQGRRRLSLGIPLPRRIFTPLLCLPILCCSIVGLLSWFRMHASQLTTTRSSGLRILQADYHYRKNPSQWANEPFRIQYSRSTHRRRQLFHHPLHLRHFEKYIDAQIPDHGGLELRLVEDVSQRGRPREIYHQFDLDLGFLEYTYTTFETDDYHDGYYAFDDDAARNPALTYDDPQYKSNSDSLHQCRRTSWHRLVTLNCNTLHEYDVLGKFRNDESNFVGCVLAVRERHFG